MARHNRDQRTQILLVSNESIDRVGPPMLIGAIRQGNIDPASGINRSGGMRLNRRRAWRPIPEEIEPRASRDYQLHICASAAHRSFRRTSSSSVGAATRDGRLSPIQTRYTRIQQSIVDNYRSATIEHNVNNVNRCYAERFRCHEQLHVQCDGLGGACHRRCPKEWRPIAWTSTTHDPSGTRNKKGPPGFLPASLTTAAMMTLCQ
jgi:hypothetical protein